MAGETTVSKGMLRSSIEHALMVMFSKASLGTRAGKIWFHAETSLGEMSKRMNLTGIFNLIISRRQGW